ncbi:uncharacterized protein LOC129913789 isoform X2 [Episyrphus balteatus]|nr:uncharacterized protein LOC129913789 isoform X2 [Episyrphus balteatus]
MNFKENVYLLCKEGNSDAINANATRMGNNCIVPGSGPYLEADVLKRCNSLPTFLSNNMYCDWKKKRKNSVVNRFITKDSNHQSNYLKDTCTFNYNPFNIETETKSLQELQSEVDALIEFRNIVIETFPDLQTKISMRSAISSQRNQSKKKKLRKKSNTPLNAPGSSVINGAGEIDETLQSFVSRSRSNSNCCRKEPKSGEGSGSTVQDSGFSTETTSSKDGYSASVSSGGLQGANNRLVFDSDDELLNLLDVIFRKTLRFRQKYPSMPHFEFDKHESYVSSASIPNILSPSSVHPKVLRFNTNHPLKQNLPRINKERDKLLFKVAELEAEIIKNRIKISKMEKKLDFFTSGNKDLEDQLKVALNENQDLSFELFQHKCDIPSRKSESTTPPPIAKKRQRETFVKRQYSKSVTRKFPEGIDHIPNSNTQSESNLLENGKLTSKLGVSSENLDRRNSIRDMNSSTIKLNPDLVHKRSKNEIQSLGKLDGVLSSPKCLCKVPKTDTTKIAAILLESNSLELQRHLLTLTIVNQAKRFCTEPFEPKSIPLVSKKRSSKLSIHQMDNTTHYISSSGNSNSLKQLTKSPNLKNEQVESEKRENIVDSICSHPDEPQILQEWEKNILPAKRPKPSRIPLLGSKTLHSAKNVGYASNYVKSSPFISIHKALSLSTGNINLKNSRQNQQDSLKLKTRRPSSSFNADSKIVLPRSVALTSASPKTNRNLETGSFFQLDSLANSKISSKTNECIQTDTKPGSNTKIIIQNKHSIPLIALPSPSDERKKVVNTMLESTDRNVIRKDAKTDNIGYLNQPGVQFLIEGITKTSYKSSITNSSNNNSMTEDEPLNDEHIGKVRNLRSTLLGWLKI